MSAFLYNVGIRLYDCALAVAAWRKHEKAQLWKDGRQNWAERLQTAINPSIPVVWIHCPSLGEFEQARPVIEGLRASYPTYQLLLSFFSPSGYEIRKNFKGVDCVCYLPLDTAVNATKFLDIVRPQLVIWTKYDFWYHFLTQLKERSIPVVLIAARFWKGQFVLRFGFMRQILQGFQQIFVQDADSLKELKALGVDSAAIAPDTRFDRVAQHAVNPQKIEEIALFKQAAKLFVAGSTWEKDEAVLLNFIAVSSNDVKFVVAPHEIKEKNILHFIEKCGQPVLRYSQYPHQNPSEAKVLILDTIGLLASAYQYADYAYIGGGFGTGIHNTLEAAVFGVPIFFGPRYQKFKEAHDLLTISVAFSIHNANELVQLFERINTSEKLKYVNQRAKKYIHKHEGGSKIVLNYLRNHL